LGETRETGVFKDAEQRRFLMKNQDLASLRRREDCQQLLREIEPR
jgi:hypothetical protein